MHILRNLEVLEIYRKFELRNLTHTHTLGVFNVVVNAHPQVVTYLLTYLLTWVIDN